MESVTARKPMRDRILEAADRLFYDSGIRATGVDTVAAAAGISKRTLYNHFPSKEALVQAYLEGRFIPVRDSKRSPLDQIRRTFDGLERTLAEPSFRGCPFVNALAELGDADPVAREIVAGFKESRRVWLLGLAEQLGARDPAALAMQIAILIDGAIVLGVVRRDPSVALVAKQSAEALVAAQTA